MTTFPVPTLQAVEASLGASPPERARILVVDDRPSDRHLLEVLLRHRGHRVFSAGEAKEGLALARAVRPDLVISDIVLPSVSGYELARWIDVDRELSATPVVLTTAAAIDDSLRGLAADVGVDFMLPKPCDPETVFEIVDAALAATRSPRPSPEPYPGEDDGHLARRLEAKVEALTTEVARLEMEDRRRRSMIDNSGDALIGVDSRGRIIEWNRAATAMFGWEAPEAKGSDVLELLCPAREREGWRGAMAEAITTGSSERFDRAVDLTGLHRDGTELDLELWASVARVGEEVTLFGCIRDSSVRKRTEEALVAARDSAEEASRTKSAFLANMSHEIRTPMNGVLGMVSLLLDTDLDERQREYAETVRASAEGLLSIMNEILDFSKIEAGKVELDAVDFDLPALVHDVARFTALAAFDKGVEFVARVGDGVPGTVRSDPWRLRQVLVNVATNAVKFTTEGEVVIDVTARPAEAASAGPHAVRFEVRDTGIGVPAHRLEALFLPFTQADVSTTRHYGGTGLGLAICRQVVDLMGGTYGVDSTEGEGSRFWFELPLSAVETPESDSRREVRSPDLAGLRVLAVDDNATNRRILAEILRRQGVEVAAVDGGAAALTEMSAASAVGRPYDVAVLDMMMPAMDGMQLAERIGADESLRSTRLVMLSSLNRPGDRGEATRRGFAGYLDKPVSGAQMLECMAEVGGRVRAAAAPEGLPEVAYPDPAASDQPRRGIRVLLADDSEVNQQVAARMLQKAGYAVDVVPDGRQAVDAVARQPYDLVLMDCQMPEMDGYEATGEIRRGEACGAHLPIVAVTASAMPEDRQRCLDAGMDAYISKPFRKEMLLEVVGEWARAGRGAGALRPLP